MATRLFDIVGGNVIMNPTILWIPEFKAIWDRDKSKHKGQAVKEISYIVFLYSFKSPYLAYSERDRKVKILRDYFGETEWEPDEIVTKAIKRYNELQETATTRLLNASLRLCDKVTEYFDSIDLNEKDRMGKPVYALNEVVKNMKDVGPVVKSLESLKEQVLKEQMDKSIIRGGTDIGLFEI
jgi:hypothetical protein